jgi:hypothetical protein
MRICPGFRLVTETRGDVGDGADGGIVEATLEADSAKRSEAVRDADAEANLVPETAPGLPLKFRWRHAPRAMSTAWSAGFSTGTGSLKTNITPSPA